MARTMLTRAFDAGMPVGWVTMDEAYGQSKSLRVWLKERDVPHVVATRRNDDLVTISMGRARADQLIAALPGQAWCRLSAGAGAHGPREYWWARIPIRVSAWGRPGRGYWPLARRSITTDQIAYYVCYGGLHRAAALELRRRGRQRPAAHAWSTSPGSPAPVGRSRNASNRRRTKPVWTSTRFGTGGPGTPTSPSPWPPTPGWSSPDPLP
ncbi:hypothetical protein GCM10027615_21550 [Plantactinospora veratri]